MGKQVFYQEIYKAILQHSELDQGLVQFYPLMKEHNMEMYIPIVTQKIVERMKEMKPLRNHCFIPYNEPNNFIFDLTGLHMVEKVLKEYIDLDYLEQMEEWLEETNQLNEEVNKVIRYVRTLPTKKIKSLLTEYEETVLQFTTEERLQMENYINVLLTVFQAELKARKLNMRMQYYTTNWCNGIKKWFNEEKLVWKLRIALYKKERMNQCK